VDRFRRNVADSMMIHCMRYLIIFIAVLCTGCAGWRPPVPEQPDFTAAAQLPVGPEVDPVPEPDPQERQMSQQEHKELSAAAAALEPLGINLVAALQELSHTRYIRDFDTAWKNVNRDPDRFYAMADALRRRFGTCSGYQLSEIHRRGEYVDVRSFVQCTQADEPLRIRFVVRYDGSVPRIVFHSFSESGAAGDEQAQ